MDNIEHDLTEKAISDGKVQARAGFMSELCKNAAIKGPVLHLFIRYRLLCQVLNLNETRLIAILYNNCFFGSDASWQNLFGEDMFCLFIIIHVKKCYLKVLNGYRFCCSSVSQMEFENYLRVK